MMTAASQVEIVCFVLIIERHKLGSFRRTWGLDREFWKIFTITLSLFRLDDFQRRDAEQEMQEQEKLRINLERVERAGVRADQPIDDSAVVDDMFGFLEDQKDTVSESQAPSAFRWMVNTSIFVIQRVIDTIDPLQGFASTQDRSERRRRDHGGTGHTRG